MTNTINKQATAQGVQTVLTASGAPADQAAEAATNKVDLAAGTVAVEYDEQTVNVDQIKAAIEDQGYDVV